MTHDPVGPLHEGRADAMPANPADGILREEPLRHSPLRLGRPRLPHPLVGLILWMIWKNDRPGDSGMAGEGALGSAIVTWLDTARQ